MENAIYFIGVQITLAIIIMVLATKLDIIECRINQLENEIIERLSKSEEDENE